MKMQARYRRESWSPWLMACVAATSCLIATSCLPMLVTASEVGTREAVADGPMTILDVSRIPSDEAAVGPRVRIRGVVTWRWHSWHAHCIVQDDTGGIWVNIAAAKEQKIWAGDDADLEAIAVGDEVEINGRMEPGGYAPNVLPITIRKVGSRPLPPPIPIDDERFFSGSDSLRRIVVEVVVQGVREGGDQDWLLLVERSSRPFVAKVPRADLADPVTMLVDAKVRMTGIPGAVYNTRGQYRHPSVLVGGAGDLEILEAPPTNPFAIASTPLELLDHFAPVPPSGHRIRTEGTVSYSLPGECFYVQEGSTGVRVAVRSQEVPTPGDRVEIAGFIDRSRDFAGLAEAVYRVVGRMKPPDPRRLTPAQIVEIARRAQAKGQMSQPGDFDGCLIRFSAKLIDARNTSDGTLLLLDAEGQSVTARLAPVESRLLPNMEAGSVIDVAGVLQIDLGDRFRARPLATVVESGSLIDRLTLLVPSAENVRLIKSAPWWTARRLAVAMAALAAVLVAALVWAAMLRRQVAAQAGRLAGEMQKRRNAALEYQASLRERNRLAANLHDTLLQTLAGAGFQLDTCRRAVGREDLGETSEHLDVARRMLNRAVGELRSNVWSLKTMPLAGQPFPEALQSLVGQIRGGHAVRLEVSTRGEPFTMPRFVVGNLLLVVQEAIRNAVRHGRPSKVVVEVGFEPDQRAVEVVVIDDGCGFVIGDAVGPKQGHFGLEGMRERIASLGGALAIDSRPGEGTRVTARIATPAFDRELEEA